MYEIVPFEARLRRRGQSRKPPPLYPTQMRRPLAQGRRFEENEPMGSFRPIHGIFIVVLVLAGVLFADYALDGGARRAGQERVQPGPDGLVRIDVSSLESPMVRYFHFINAGNQEVEFFVSRDRSGELQVAFDANEVCYKKRRGYRAEGDWVVCNACDKAFRIAEINDGGGGCKPVPLEFQVTGNQLLLREDAVLRGWRYFR